MPPSKSQKTETKVLETETTDSVVSASSMPKKGRKTAKVAAAPKVEKSIPAKTTKKVKAEAASDEEDISKSAEAPAKITINRVKAKAVLEAEQAPKPKPKKAPAKRKAKVEDEEDEEGEDNKVKKKRKTKEEKEAEAMPLAERTAIGVLKKSMHIGAHVSAAGGMNSGCN